MDHNIVVVFHLNGIVDSIDIVDGVFESEGNVVGMGVLVLGAGRNVDGVFVVRIGRCTAGRWLIITVSVAVLLTGLLTLVPAGVVDRWTSDSARVSARSFVA